MPGDNVTLAPAFNFMPPQYTPGLMVTAVDADGPAADKLLPARSPGGTDIITHINGQRVKTVNDLNAALKDVKAGEVVSLQTWVVRGPDSSTRVVRLRVASGK